MTSSEEQAFIRLWQEGASYRDIAQTLGCALGTVGSRAAALVRQGKIQPRPKGGNYPRQKAQGRHEGTPAPPATPAVDRKDIQQWTVRLSKALIEHLKTVAYERRIPPSQLVEELVWKALMDHHPWTPSSASTPDRKSSWK
jgi:transposase